MDSEQTRLRRLPRSTESWWWRFDSYEIRGGWICAKNPEKISWYDPWTSFTDMRGRGSRQGHRPDSDESFQPPYMELVRLVNRLELDPGKRFPEKLSPASQKAIAEWCARHGPLGVLLSRWDSITLERQPDGQGNWIERTYTRGFGQHVQTRDTTGDVEAGRSKVLLHSLIDLTAEEEEPRKTWGRFFPAVTLAQQNRFAYPEPYTDEFARHYAERLFDFYRAAKMFSDAVRILGSTEPRNTEQEELAYDQALDFINILRRGINLLLIRELGQNLTRRAVAPSLLASFAEMFAQDLQYQLPLRQCIACGTPFVSPAYQAKYCSVTCRLREQKRHLRRQMKEAAALHAAGQDVLNIAAALGQERSVVRGWLKRAKRKG